MRNSLRKNCAHAIGHPSRRQHVQSASFFPRGGNEHRAHCGDHAALVQHVAEAGAVRDVLAALAAFEVGGSKT